MRFLQNDDLLDNGNFTKALWKVLNCAICCLIVE